jgi:nucleotide-binding universal stress UspA family protein
MVSGCEFLDRPISPMDETTGQLGASRSWQPSWVTGKAIQRERNGCDVCADRNPTEVQQTRILVGVDATPQSELACTYAAEIARCLGATLIAVHVVERIWTSSFFTGKEAHEATEVTRSAARGSLAKAAVRARRAPALWTELAFGDAAEQLCQQAEALPADLIVLGKRQRDFTGRLLARSVSSRVVQRAPCAVLVVPDHAAAEPAGVHRTPQHASTVQRCMPCGDQTLPSVAARH